MNIRVKQVVFIICCAVALAIYVKPVYATTAGTMTKLTIVKGLEYQVPNAFWYCKYQSSDDAVVEVDESGFLTGKKAGKAVIRQTNLTGVALYQVTVVEKVDVVVMMGQSNMVGSGGNVVQSPTIDVAAFQYGNKKFSQLRRQGNLIPAFANSYVKESKTPIVVIQTAVGGSSSNGWVNRGYAADAAKELKACLYYLKKNKAQVGHVYCLWLQGETDASVGVLKNAYMANVRTIASRMHKAGSEKFLIIQVGQYRDNHHPMNEIHAAQKELCKKYNKQFAMATDKAYKLSKNSSNFSDSVHFNQNALNKIGKAAGKYAGKLAKKTKK